MSMSKRSSPFANSGLMITLEPAHFGGNSPLAGMELQRKYERLAYDLSRGAYLCPIQTADDFLHRRKSRGAPPSSYIRGVIPAELERVIPPQVAAALRSGLPQLDRRWNGRFLAGATLVGPESRGSAPVRFLRDDATLECTSVAGLYPVGEGRRIAGCEGDHPAVCTARSSLDWAADFVAGHVVDLLRQFFDLAIV
jgi:uncharacterized FAD-dependent dehydrogenase